MSRYDKGKYIYLHWDAFHKPPFESVKGHISRTKVEEELDHQGVIIPEGEFIQCFARWEMHGMESVHERMKRLQPYKEKRNGMFRVSLLFREDHDSDSFLKS